MTEPLAKELDLAVVGGVIVTAGEERSLDIGIAGGRITVLAEPGMLPAARREVSAAGLYVLPGGIDTHTHIRWPIPGAPDSLDDFRTGTMAAAIGGTTTVVDFVPQPQGVSHWAAANARMEEAAGAAVVDYSFHPILTRADQQTLFDVRRLIEAGLGSFKVYTTSTDPLDDAEIRSLSVAIAEGGGLAGFHAENHDIIERTRGSVGPLHDFATQTFHHSRPAAAESESIAMVTHFARELGAPVYIYHVSSTAALRAITEARLLGTDVFAETCTHYLTFDDSVYQQADAWKYVITPPIRDSANQDALWSALLGDGLQCIASDHCAYSRAHKLPEDRYETMPPGAPGISARMAFAWARGVARRRLTPVEYARVTAENAARIFGMYPRKGVIAVGSDADLVLLDPRRQWVWPEDQVSLGSDYDPYDSLSGVGWPVMTLSRGRVVAENGRPVDADGGGQFVPQAISLPASMS